MAGIGALLLFMIAGSLNAAAKNPPKLQKNLPSEVKRIKVKERLKPEQKAKKAKEFNKFTSDFAEKREETLAPDTSSYRNRTAFYWHSSYPLPASYICDSSQGEAKLEAAKSKAMAKCEANGDEICTLKAAKIIKNGPLACGDIPGECDGSKYYAGCVAEAVVIGEKGAPIVDSDIASTIESDLEF